MPDKQPFARLYPCIKQWLLFYYIFMLLFFCALNYLICEIYITIRKKKLPSKHIDMGSKYGRF